MENETLSVRAAAKLMGIGKDTLYVALNSGQLPGVRIGRRWVLGRALVDRVLRGELPQAFTQQPTGAGEGR